MSFRTTLNTRAFLFASLTALAFAPSACTPDKLGGEGGGPPGSGGFDPGGGSPTGSSTSGNTGGTTTTSSSTTTDPQAPCKNDDSLKRCAHTFTYQDQGESSVEVRGDWGGPATWQSGAMMTKSAGVWSATVDVPWSGNVQYKLVLNGSTWITDPANPDTINDGSGNTNSLYKGEMCSDYTCSMPPVLGYDWRDAVMYFVFVDRFNDGDPANNGSNTGAEATAEYKGGDWKGVTAKINSGYFTDLGVNALWITVPMQNPNNKELGTDGKYYSAYHGYWPANLDKPEEHFGTDQDLQDLIDAAHAKDIKVLFDYAMNHVHVSSPIYQQHMNDGWFNPNQGPNGGNCVCGQGCDWNNQAEVCWFTDYLPDFNFDNAAARKYSVDNAISWAKKGADGFRLDAVKHIKTSWITDLRSRVTTEIEPTTGNHFYMVGETFTGDVGLIASFIDPTTKLDGQFDFPLRVALAETVLMRKAPMSNLDGALNTSAGSYGFGVMSTFIGNHDMPRAINFAQDTPAWDNVWADGKDKNFSNTPGQPAEKSAYERLATAYAVLFTSKGIPLVYYGDEYGLAGGGDPDNRRMMQWSNYSANQTFLNTQLKKLTKIRADHSALRRGARSSIGSTSDTLAYKMVDATETVYVVINRGDSQQSVGGLPSGQMNELMSGTTMSGPSVNVPPRSALILTP
ncbi:MAG: alpha-amylase family glycosyl hydrolase [Polyangiaceae bacterium]